MEGEFEQLVLKARFEEAKFRDIPGNSQTTPRMTFSQPNPTDPPRSTASRQQQGAKESRQQTKQPSTSNVRCFNCGGVGHLARNCRQRGQDNPEARGRTQSRGSDRVAAINPLEDQGKQPPPPSKRVLDLRRQLNEAELEEALETVTARISGIT